MAGQQNCQPKQLHGGFSVEREICTVELHTREVLRRFFGSQRFLGNWASPELPTLAVTRCLFGPDTQNWTPWKFYGQLSGVVAKLHTWAVSRRLFGPEQSIEILSREITSQLSGWWAGGIDTGHIITHEHSSHRNANSFCTEIQNLKKLPLLIFMHTISLS